MLSRTQIYELAHSKDMGRLWAMSERQRRTPGGLLVEVCGEPLIVDSYIAYGIKG